LNACERLLDDGLAVGHGRARRIEVGLRLVDLRLERGGVDSGNQLAFADLRVEVSEQGQEFPDTCEPTCTVTTAFGLPVADTVTLMSPRSTVVVR
jgi:hypothetical protein